jgi:hypothetical protein
LRKTDFMLVLVAIVAFGLVAAAALSAPMLSDEVFSVETANLALPQMWVSLQYDVHPPLYYLLLHLWQSVWAGGEASLRAFSLFWLVWASLLLFLLLRREWGITFAWAGTAALLANPLLLLMGGYGRMYTLLEFFCVATMWFAAPVVREPFRWNRQAALAFCVACGALTHNWYLFFLCGIAAWAAVLWGRACWKLLPGLVAGAVLFSLVWWQGALSQLSASAGQLAWLKKPGWTNLFDTGLAHGVLFLYALPCLLIAAGILRKAKQAELPGSQLALASAAGLFVSVGLPFLISQWKPVFNPRFTVIAAPFLALLVAVPVSRLGRAGCAILLLAAALWAGREWKQVERCNSRSAAEGLRQLARPGDTVVFARLSRKPIEWYWHDDRVARHSFPAAIDSHPGYEGDWSTPEKQELLRQEARAIAAAGARVIVIADQSAEPSRILIETLRERMIEGTRLMSCPNAGKQYFNTLAVFTPRN